MITFIKFVYFFSFSVERVSCKSDMHLKENDMILLSSLTDNQVGISQGFIKSINNSKTVFSLLIDKNLSSFNSKYHNDHLFRIDKINFRSSLTLNYTNLARLMNNDKKSERLRSFIINKAMPEFETVLPKQAILKTKNLFKKLNQSQHKAILKVLLFFYLSLNNSLIFISFFFSSRHLWQKTIY